MTKKSTTLYLLRVFLDVDLDRLSRTPDGRVVALLERPWPTTGETEVFFEATEFLRELAALVVATHSHGDRASGAGVALARGIPVYGHERTA